MVFFLVQCLKLIKMKINNFSAGPSKIPNEVINTIKGSIENFNNLGYSILEISHRSSEFLDIVNNSKILFSQLLNIPSNYEIVFLQGGATFQNSFLPLNFPNLNKDIIFLLTGTWGKKTYDDFNLLFANNLNNITYNNHTLKQLTEEISLTKQDKMFLTSNETINGIQLRNFNSFNKQLYIDMSSDICSYGFSWENVEYVFAGAQKNLGIPGLTIIIFDPNKLNVQNIPSYLNLQNHLDKNSLFNTPPTFSIYVFHEMLNWMKNLGGLEYIENLNRVKSESVYAFLDSHEEIIQVPVNDEFRSLSNIIFNFKNKDYDKAFLEFAKENGFIGLNGHRSVGGIRVSNYNSITKNMIDDLLSLLNDFILKNDNK